MSRSLVQATLLGLAGLLFVAFPTLRPYGDGSADPKVVAQTFASDAWVVAHVIGMFAFILLPLGLHGLKAYANDGWLAYVGFLLCATGSGLTAAFFGAEAFGLQSIGQQALRESRTDALEVANALRFGPAIVVFSLGTLAVAIGTLLYAFAVWGSPRLPRWSSVALAAGIVLWVIVLALAAQAQAVRIAESLIIAAGSLSLAWEIRRGPVSSS